MTWAQRVLSAIAHPQIAYLLLMLGTLGLTIELWSPGAILPGVVGGICLLLAFFAFQVLPVSYAGVLLILFGLVLLDPRGQGHELRPARRSAGSLSLFFGSMMLMDSPLPELQVGLRLIVPVTLALVGDHPVPGAAGGQGAARPAVTGEAGMLGETGPGADGDRAGRRRAGSGPTARSGLRPPTEPIHCWGYGPGRRACRGCC